MDRPKYFTEKHLKAAAYLGGIHHYIFALEARNAKLEAVREAVKPLRSVATRQELTTIICDVVKALDACEEGEEDGN